LFHKYTKDTFQSLNKQHNIMVLVGNGFDLAVLSNNSQGRMAGKTTSYQDFFDYISYFGLTDDGNILYKKMHEKNMEDPRPENWADFECIIDELVKDGIIGVTELERCVDEFQSLFTRFLNDIVDADLLIRFNKEVQEKKLANQSMSSFLKDVEESSGIEFPQKTSHYDLYNFLFVNFNYTSLLDNYIYMDKGQFDPHKWSNADRNFSFFPDLAEQKSGTIWSSYYLADVVHPHGVQDIPRSILFGIDIPNFNKGTSKEKRLVKSYWSRYDVKYGGYFNDAELFIIFGLSISKTDGWWYDKIYESILNNSAELIIYRFGNDEDNEVKNTFVGSCIRHLDDSEENKEIVKKNIYVVSFIENNTYFLGLEEK